MLLRGKGLLGVKQKRKGIRRKQKPNPKQETRLNLYSFSTEKEGM